MSHKQNDIYNESKEDAAIDALIVKSFKEAGCSLTHECCLHKKEKKLEKALYKIQKIALVQRRNSRLQAILSIVQSALSDRLVVYKNTSCGPSIPPKSGCPNATQNQLRWMELLNFYRAGKSITSLLKDEQNRCCEIVSGALPMGDKAAEINRAIRGGA